MIALSSLALLAGCGSPDEGGPVKLNVAPGCNPLSPTGECLLPFPNAFLTKEDAASPTGARLAYDADKLPKRDQSVPLDVGPYNTADGFSPVVPILVHFGVDVDTAPLPDQHELDQSVAEGSPIAILDMETGKRVMFFAEMDANRRDDWPDRYALILRPLEPMAMGHRHVVVMTDKLRDKNGGELPVSPGFSALVSGAPTDNAALEAQRAHYEEVFAFLAKHGYAREDLLLAWDFPVASEDYVFGSVLSMREEALKVAKSGGLPYTITKITDNPSPVTARIVEGDFEVPTYVREDDTFEYDAQHHPVRQAKNRSYPFTLVIPKAAEAKALPLAVLGHGIFGNGRDFVEGNGDGTAIQQLANEHGVVVIATDWIGLSTKDKTRLAEIGTDIDRLGLVTDQLQQALINALTLQKLGKGALKDDPKVKLGPGDLIDTSHVYYWGASLGGIEGTGFVAINDDIQRAVFGVPGSAWCTMISRSIVFPPIRAFLEPHYPDPLEFTLALSVIQSRFDNADPANLGKLLFQKPLPDAPKDRRVIFQESIGDSQVPNMTTELLARSVGVKLMTPSVTPVFGLDPVTSPAPGNDSVLVQFRLPNYDKPLPPEDNVPPAQDNDVHHDMNFLPNAQAQIVKLWFEGAVEQSCDGPCDPD
jgi:hypothetical protein